MGSVASQSACHANERGEWLPVRDLLQAYICLEGMPAPALKARPGPILDGVIPSVFYIRS